jgi:hypothetical protein
MNITIRALSVLAVAAVIAVVIGSNTMRANAAGTDDRPTPQILIPTTAPQNPVVVYDVSGSTLAGLIHFRLSVYDTGHASISAAGYDQFAPHGDDELCPQDGKAAFTFVGAGEAKKLHFALKDAGAFQARNGMLAVDVPMQTVTVFDKTTADAKAHTFTFHFSSSEEITQTLEVIHAFIDEHFPGF